MNKSVMKQQRKRKKCRKCGQPLGFRLNTRGRWEPCNIDGSDHYDLCRQKRNERIRNSADSIEFREEKVINTKHGLQVQVTTGIQGGGDRLTRAIEGVVITGDKFRREDWDRFVIEQQRTGAVPW